MANASTLAHVSRLYICGPLFSIIDFKKQLCQMELEISNPRYLMDNMPIKWPKKEDIENLNEWEIYMSLKVDPTCWGPRKLRRHELVWDEKEGTFTESGDLIQVLSSGHRCKQEPSAVAQFPMESRENMQNSVYNQFTTLLEVKVFEWWCFEKP